MEFIIEAFHFYDKEAAFVGIIVEENRNVAHREERLTRLLQYADNWSGGVVEREKDA